jgi:hypothetical protein
VGASIGSFFASWGMGWINLKTKKMEDVEAAEAAEAAKRAKTEKEKGAGDVFVTES